MRFSLGEIVFHRTEIRTKVANVAEVNIEKVRGGIEMPLRSNTKRGVRSRGISGPPSEWKSESE